MIEAVTPVRKTVKLGFQILQKSAPDSAEHFIAGWAYTSMDAAGNPIFDASGDHIPVEELRKAMHSWLRDFAVGGEMHEGAAPNQAQEMVITTVDVQKAWAHDVTCEGCGQVTHVEKFLPEGAWVRIGTSASLVAKVRAGGRLMFSIEGTAVKEPIQ